METTTGLQQLTLDLSSLSRGIYFVQVYTPSTKNTQVKKLIVQ
jgi:hypothetical protein